MTKTKTPLGRYGSAQATPAHFSRVPLRQITEIPLPERIVPPEIEVAPRFGPLLSKASVAPAIRDTEGRKWFLLVLAPGSDRRALRGLLERGYAAYSPTETLWVQHSRTQPRIRREVQRPILNRYLFLGKHDDQSWIGVNERDRFGQNLLGILGVLTNNGWPIALPVSEIAKLARREREGWFDEKRLPLLEKGAEELARPLVEAGEAVRITKGPLLSHNGNAESDAAGGKVRVWVSIFGQQSMVVLPLEDVENLDRDTKRSKKGLHGPLL